MWRTFVVFLCVSCGGSDTIGSDAGDGDAAAVPEAGPDIPWLSSGVPPIDLSCPDGWRVVEGRGPVPECDPWPGDAPEGCPAGQAHFPGEPGCTDVGSACPVGDFPDDLPSDTTVTHVVAGATGGDGTRALPYGSFSDFSFARLRRGDVIAAGRGAYGEVRLPAGVELRGACSAATTLSSTVASDRAGVITVRGDSVIVRDVGVTASPRSGVWALGAGVGVHLDGVAITGAELFATAVSEGGRLTADTLAIADTGGSSLRGNLFGRAIHAQGDAGAEVRRAFIQNSRDIAVYAGESTDVRLVLEDAAVRGTRADGLGNLGRGFEVQRGSTAELRRSTLEDNQDTGVMTLNGGVLRMEDAIVRDTRTALDSTGGHALQIQDGATVLAERVVFAGNHGAGTVVWGVDAGLTLSDAVVRDTLPERDGRFGRGIGVEDGARATLARVAFVRNVEVAVNSSDPGTQLELEDVLVRDTASRDDGMLGRGASSQMESTLIARRLLLVENREVSIAAASGSRMTLDDVGVRDALVQACADSTCPDRAFGMGIGAYTEGSLAATRFSVTAATSCGVQVAADGTMSLSAGTVEGCAIGACVQVAGFDVAQLQAGVAYRDNGVNLQATSLPVPGPLEVVGTR